MISHKISIENISEKLLKIYRFIEKMKTDIKNIERNVMFFFNNHWISRELMNLMNANFLISILMSRRINVRIRMIMKHTIRITNHIWMKMGTNIRLDKRRWNQIQLKLCVLVQKKSNSSWGYQTFSIHFFYELKDSKNDTRRSIYEILFVGYMNYVELLFVLKTQNWNFVISDCLWYWSCCGTST